MTTTASPYNVRFKGLKKGGFSAWTGIYGSPVVETNNPYEGTYNAKASAQNNFAYKTITPNAITYARAYFKISTLPSEPADVVAVLKLMYNGWENSVTAVIVWDGSKPVWLLNVSIDSNDYNTVTNIEVLPDTWYCVEILRDVTNQTSKLWVNRNLIAQRLSDAHSGDNNLVYVGIEWITSLATNVYFDYATIADAHIGPEYEHFRLEGVKLEGVILDP